MINASNKPSTTPPIYFLFIDKSFYPKTRNLDFWYKIGPLEKNETIFFRFAKTSPKNHQIWIAFRVHFKIYMVLVGAVLAKKSYFP